MHLDDISTDLPDAVVSRLKAEIQELRPAQSKACDAGLLQGKSLLICTPTASGKTLIAELAGTKSILEDGGKAIYIVPLKALAYEKYRHFSRRYAGLFDVALSVGDMDDADPKLASKDFIFTTSEKLDSLIRHHTPWLSKVRCVIIDEIHLLNDPGRGPTLEILISILKRVLPKLQIIGLSATIGNPQELADWLGATLVMDTWRPVVLHEGIALDHQVTFSDAADKHQ